MIDLRSDTVTLQPEEMLRKMISANVGDDVYRDDPTINELEEKAARLVGKPAALFVLSGTMGNQLAIMSQTGRGERIIAGLRYHSVNHEVAGPALLSGVMVSPVDNPDDMIWPEDIRQRVWTGDIHEAPVSLLCLENALGNGTVVPLDLMKADYAAAKEAGLNVHLDGARLFNAAEALGCDAAEIAHYTDTVMFCLSKGLSAPVGSILAGPTDIIEKTRRYRKMLGGGIRQGGYLAACGIYALEHMRGRLKEDHENARYLAAKLNQIPGIEVDEEKVQINMVYFTVTKNGVGVREFIKTMNKEGILMNPPSGNTYRIVTHYGISREDCDTVAAAITDYLETRR